MQMESLRQELIAAYGDQDEYPIIADVIMVNAKSSSHMGALKDLLYRAYIHLQNPLAMDWQRKIDDVKIPTPYAKAAHVFLRLAKSYAAEGLPPVLTGEEALMKLSGEHLDPETAHDALLCLSHHRVIVYDERTTTVYVEPYWLAMVVSSLTSGRSLNGVVSREYMLSFLAEVSVVISLPCIPRLMVLG